MLERSAVSHICQRGLGGRWDSIAFCLGPAGSAGVFNDTPWDGAGQSVASVLFYVCFSTFALGGASGGLEQ